MREGRGRTSLRVSRASDEPEKIHDRGENEISHIQVRNQDIHRGNVIELSRYSVGYEITMRPSEEAALGLQTEPYGNREVRERFNRILIGGPQHERPVSGRVARDALASEAIGHVQEAERYRGKRLRKIRGHYFRALPAAKREDYTGQQSYRQNGV